jgi:hypothetical protein
MPYQPNVQRTPRPAMRSQAVASTKPKSPRSGFSRRLPPAVRSHP